MGMRKIVSEFCRGLVDAGIYGVNKKASIKMFVTIKNIKIKTP